MGLACMTDACGQACYCVRVSASVNSGSLRKAANFLYRVCEVSFVVLEVCRYFVRSCALAIIDFYTSRYQTIRLGIVTSPCKLLGQRVSGCSLITVGRDLLATTRLRKNTSRSVHTIGLLRRSQLRHTAVSQITRF